MKLLLNGLKLWGKGTAIGVLCILLLPGAIIGALSYVALDALERIRGVKL